MFQRRLRTEARINSNLDGLDFGIATIEKRKTNCTYGIDTIRANTQQNFTAMLVPSEDGLRGQKW